MKKLMLAAAGLVLAAPSTSSAAPASGSPIADEANCVAWFTTTLAHAGVAGPVIANGAQSFAPFGRNVVSQQAAGERSACPFDPSVFVP